LIQAARAVNDGRAIRCAAGAALTALRLGRPRSACLGLGYKEDSDDVRGSPALRVVTALAEADVGELLVVEPHLSAPPAALARFGIGLTDLADALASADLVLPLVAHSAFAGATEAPLT
jgi:UDP-N-acetyl-D-mannosaminuronic acid dehydrogenase